MTDTPPPPPPSEPRPGLPEGIPAPPPPRPDLKDIRQVGSTYGPDKNAKKKKGKRERTHPTDPYQPLKKRRGGGCCGCLGGIAGLVILLLIALVALVGYYGPGRFVSEGYKVVNLEPDVTTLETAPDEPTLYIAQGSLHYRAPLTAVPVAFIARELLIEGDFHDEASITAAKVTATGKARFAKDLEIFAAEFTDQGMTLKGNLNGRVIQNKP